MKKIILVVLLAIIVTSSFAQGWYISGGLGYALPQAGGGLDMNGNPYSGSIIYANSKPIIQGTANVNITSFSMQKASFSSGLQWGLDVGYMLNEHVGIELGINALLAPSKNTLNTNNEIVYDTFFVNATRVQYASTLILLSPSIIFQQDYKKFNFYTKMGVALPISRNIVYELTNNFGASNGYATGLPNEVDFLSFAYKTDFSIGFTGALGVAYKLNNQFHFYCDISLLSLSLYVNEIDNTSISVNNNPYSPNPGYKLGFKGTNVNQASGTGTQFSSDLPCSNIAFNLGFRYYFGGQQQERSKSQYHKYNTDKVKRF